MRIYAATTNPGKLRDFGGAAEGARIGGKAIAIEPLGGLAKIPAPPEDEPTFEGNARAKAIYYSRHAPGMLVLADDSGLEVACLDGAPGGA
jgi:XTP/dITP diphosphohydrolase